MAMHVMEARREAWRGYPREGRGLYRHSNNRIRYEQFPLPVQDQAPGKMPASFHSRHAGYDSILRTDWAVDERDCLRRARLAAEPFLVVEGNADGAVEC